MKALLHTGTQASEIRDADALVAATGETLADLAFCGICGSDMHAWHGNDARRALPLILGHEAVGTTLNGGPHAGKPVATPAADSLADIVLDAVGSGNTRMVASAIVRPGGVIVHVGLEDSEPGLDTRRFTLQDITFSGTYCYRPDDFAEALCLLTEGAVSGAGWTEIRDLDAGAQTFLDIHEGHAPPKIILATR